MSRGKRTTTRWLCRLGIISSWALGTLVLATPAHAADWFAPDPDACTPPTPAALESAKEAFRAGQSAFNEGAYAQAVEHWTAAYAQDCTAHALLLNLATARELLGRPDDAIHALLLFNKRVPGSPYVEANLKRIDRLQRASTERDRERARREAVSKPIRVRTSAEPKEPEPLSIPVPVAVAATGTVLAVAGTVLFVEGRLSSSAAADKCPEGQRGCADTGAVIAGERARSRAQAGGWVIGAGLITTAGGVVWALLSGHRSTEAATARSPATGWDLAVASDGAELHVGGSF